ncbi:helix-turn-helix domain-containing protein [Saccharolobus shibatae]|uniref:Transcriptional regulator, wHTH n=1 Tax=Saccharolobus shibatae TaxID=2286 RepID=A0A8F5C435_9CREN|nr:helix-turn-helix domain-containing protein [Saccharolobus shibatae]QXJ36591.1 Transcriptional regulator, wHTH [Saccharolobus shibatae]
MSAKSDIDSVVKELCEKQKEFTNSDVIEKTGLHKSTVSKRLKELEINGFISKVEGKWVCIDSEDPKQLLTVLLKNPKNRVMSKRVVFKLLTDEATRPFAIELWKYAEKYIGEVELPEHIHINTFVECKPEYTDSTITTAVILSNILSSNQLKKLVENFISMLRDEDIDECLSYFAFVAALIISSGLVDYLDEMYDIIRRKDFADYEGFIRTIYHEVLEIVNSKSS